MNYHKSKNLNVSSLELEKNAKFNDIEVDTNVSTIHVPTHVYDECTYRTCWSPDWQQYYKTRVINSSRVSAKNLIDWNIYADSPWPPVDDFKIFVVFYM